MSSRGALAGDFVGDRAACAMVIASNCARARVANQRGKIASVREAKEVARRHAYAQLGPRPVSTSSASRTPVPCISLRALPRPAVRVGDRIVHALAWSRARQHCEAPRDAAGHARLTSRLVRLARRRVEPVQVHDAACPSAHHGDARHPPRCSRALQRTGSAALEAETKTRPSRLRRDATMSTITMTVVTATAA